MVSTEECRGLIEKCREEHNKFWLSIFSKHGYSLMEEDNTKGDYYETPPDDNNLEGIAVGEERINKKLIFWKEKDINGIVMGEIEHENEHRKKSYRTRFYAIGKAFNYFNDLYKSQKESKIRKLLRFGKEKTLYEITEKIKIREKDYHVMLILPEREFQELV